MMLITHASSSLSASLVQTLNNHNFNYLVVTDDDPEWKPPTGWHIQAHLLPTPLPDWFAHNQQELEFAFCLDETDSAANDVHFQILWRQCIDHQVPLIFRTTAARSAWIAEQFSAPFFWAGLRVAHSSAPAVTQAAYFLVHHRQQSGEFAVDDVNQNYLRD